MPRVFFITGTSTGFGNHLVQEVLDKGDIAVATARRPETLKFKGTNDEVETSYHQLKITLLTFRRTSLLSSLMSRRAQILSWHSNIPSRNLAG